MEQLLRKAKQLVNDIDFGDTFLQSDAAQLLKKIKSHIIHLFSKYEGDSLPPSHAHPVLTFVHSLGSKLDGFVSELSLLRENESSNFIYMEQTILSEDVNRWTCNELDIFFSS